MRQRSQKQMYLRKQSKSTSMPNELQAMSEILDSLPEYETILDMVLNDLHKASGCESATTRGRNGMTAEQVLKSFIVKHYRNCSYRELEALAIDSRSVEKFIGLDPWSDGFSYKTFQKNIKCLSEETIDFFLQKLSTLPKRKILKMVLKHAQMPQQ